MPENITKVCSGCNQQLSIEMFHSNGFSALGECRRRSACKDCEKKRGGKRQEARVGYQKKYQKKYREENKEKLTEHKKKYEKRYREASLRYQKKYREENKEKRARYQKGYQKEYRKNPQVKLRQLLRGRLCNAIKVSGGKKFISALDLVGCTIEELRRHVGSKFQEGMTWDNHGLCGWHIDHIKPCCSFDLTEEEQQKECFHFTNLQPLWAKDNLSKGGRV